MTDNSLLPQITFEQLHDYQQAFAADDRNRLALNAVTKNPINSVVLDRNVVTASNHTFSHQLKSNDITSQAASGRCWLFAGLNLFRVEAMKHLNVEKFELSQNYMMFWDKLEKANYFLESMLMTLDEPSDGRLIMFLLQNPVQDGGQWDMFVNLVEKYGVLPKNCMPETDSSSNTRWMVALITAKLREYAAELRGMHRQGSDEAVLRARKTAMLADIYRMLVIHLGEPPHSFAWQWRDKDNNFHRDGAITPQEFFKRYVQYDLDSMVCLINCPTADKPFNKLYTVEYLGNVVGGRIVRYLNVDIATFKKAASDMIVAGTPVWFGCDYGRMIERDLGIMDMNLYDYRLAYNTGFTAAKAQRVEYGDSQMTHAMVFTGVDIGPDGKPLKWRVENSHGEKVGDKGFLVMADNWFDEYLYEVAVEKRTLAPEVLAILATEPVKLHPWDPHGGIGGSGMSRLRFMTAGESHGPSLTAILEGMPAGLPLSSEQIDHDLARRQQGYGSGGRMKIERDHARITSGVMAGRTTGAPIAFSVENLDHAKWRDRDIEPMTIPRPGHADLTAAVKYGYRELRLSLERASARETTMRVAAGAACRALLAEFGITVGGYVTSIGTVTTREIGDWRLEINPWPPIPTGLPAVSNLQSLISNLKSRIAAAEASDVRCYDESVAEQMRALIRQTMQDKDTLGGVVECVALNVPPGLGTHVHWDRKLSTRIAAAVMSIHAVKGVEIGDGFVETLRPGTQVQDELNLADGQIVQRTNHAGGLEGGISNGAPIVVRAAFKPIATTLNPLQSVDLASGEQVHTRYERSDFCQVPRAVPIVESMLCFVLADALTEKLGGDSIDEMRPRFEKLRQMRLDQLPMDNAPWKFGYE